VGLAQCAWAGAAPVIDAAGLRDGEAGVFYDELIYADGSGIVWSAAPDSLPPGLRIESVSQGLDYGYARIYGIPADAGTYAFAVKAENAAHSDTKEFSIVIIGFRPQAAADAALPDVEAAAPAGRLAGGFTAGPNPAAKSSGEVNFFRQGERAAGCDLRIYDIAGNVVNRVKIVDDAAGTMSKRQVGSWDFRDAKGRLVPDGTYLVWGALRTPDGGSEKVSLILSVR